MRNSIKKYIYWCAKFAANSYIAGNSVVDAINVCQKYSKLGISTTICAWDSPEDKKELVLSKYKETLEAIIKSNIDCYLSIKAPSLRYNDGMLFKLIEIACEYNIRIHFDSLNLETASASMDLLERMIGKYNGLGYTLPSSWRRSFKDAEKIIDFGIPVRVVKGQWPEAALSASQIRDNFLKLIDILAGNALQVGVATHDTLLAFESLNRLKNAGTNCELEQLFGLPIRMKNVSKPLDVPIRVYVPYGHAYLSYALSKIKNRPIILFWFIRDFFTGLGKSLI